NLNTASAEQLMKLSGIGESKAAQIISYREKNGAFKKIEDIMNITGIKEGVFGKIKDDITV
ncbi:MAG: ComEA family DNA-binding protein, partial [Clostridium sp.]